MIKRSFFAVALLMTAAMPASAQDIATRIFNIENQIRQLTGQIEELNHSVQELQRQMGGAQPQKTQQQGTLQLPDSGAQKQPQKKLALAPSGNDGSESILDPGANQDQAVIFGGDSSSAQVPAARPVQVPSAGGSQQDAELAPGESGSAPATVADGTADGNGAAPVEQVALNQAAETPESVYEHGIESLLRRQFPDAEQGFRSFLQKYPDHNLAGSAQYQLGETFYAQADYRSAAQNYLQGYKNYPKSRRAPDSLVKLGISLNKLGQKDQGCAALNSVATEFPKATEAKKRAQVESQRAGC